jgi:acyl carrier protein
MNRTALEQELKQIVVESLMLEGTSVADIDSEKPLFVEGLGLDSIDALELGMALSKRYGIQIDSSDERIRKAFHSIRSLAEFVEQNRETVK